MSEVKEEYSKEERVKPRIPHPTMKHPVTDLKYMMDGYLKTNLDEVPVFLEKAWDCVIIVSGSGKVRCGKSTLAMQVAYYEAYLLNEQKKKKGLVPKDNPVPFDTTHIAFDPDGLMKIAGKLPRNSVMVYDEGRAGLDSARAMENINKAMQDFFQECGQYGHVIVIVLPDFFKLNETIAVPRSLFLINVYTDKEYNRGYFSFFNEHKKEMLYIIGKKKFGSTSKYMAVQDNFHGKFGDFFPVNKDLYDEMKKDAIKKRRKTRLEIRWHFERDVMMYILNKEMGYTAEDIEKRMNSYPTIKITAKTIQRAWEKVEKIRKQEYLEEND